jgi:cytochrome c biogenesis protein CcdA
MLATAALGVFVVLVELPCTGAPYFAVLGLLAEGMYDKAVPLLLLYNFIFVLPLLIVIIFAYFGATSERLEALRKEHRGIMRLGIGIFLLALGIYMLMNLPF